MQAPEGTQISVKSLDSKLTSDPECLTDYIMINSDGDRSYPVETTQIFCDTSRRNNILVSSSNELYVAYQATDSDSAGFKMVVQIE